MLLVCGLQLALQMPRELGSNSELENVLMVMQVLRSIASIHAEKLLNYLINKVYTSMVVGFLVLYAATGGLNEATQSRQSPLIQVTVIQGTNQVWKWQEAGELNPVYQSWTETYHSFTKSAQLLPRWNQVCKIPGCFHYCSSCSDTALSPWREWTILYQL